MMRKLTSTRNSQTAGDTQRRRWVSGRPETWLIQGRSADIADSPFKGVHARCREGRNSRPFAGLAHQSASADWYRRLKVFLGSGLPLPVAHLALAVLLIWPSFILAQESKAIQLSAPQMDGGKPLMRALKERASARTFSPEKLPVQVLSNMLWAAYGINRPASGGRTAPSASNSQEMDIYVAMADGLFLYDAKATLLKPVVGDDVRALTGRQPFVKEAPVTLIYVSDQSKMTRAAPADRDFYEAAHTGFISQNVYLFCASEGLATVVRASVDRPALAKAMGLRPDQKITLVQSVGYPKK